MKMNINPYGLYEKSLKIKVVHVSDFLNLRKKTKTGYIWPLHELITQSAKLTFSGWEDVSPQDNVQAVFQYFPEDDQKLACDHFFRKLCK